MRCVGLLSPFALTGNPADLVVNGNIAASRQDVRVIWHLQDEAEAFMLVPWRLLQASEIKHPWPSWRRVTTNVPKRTKNREKQVLHCLLLLLAGLQSSWQWWDTPTQRSCFTWRVFCWWMSKTTSWIELLIGRVRIQVLELWSELDSSSRASSPYSGVTWDLKWFQSENEWGWVEPSESVLLILMCLFCLKLTGGLSRGGSSSHIQLQSHDFLFTCLYKVGWTSEETWTTLGFTLGDTSPPGDACKSSIFSPRAFWNALALAVSVDGLSGDWS